MSMFAFHHLFPREASDEAFAVTPVGQPLLPERTFLFVEAYCVEPRCDCRRVLLSIIDADRREQVATINHAFEPPRPPFDDEGQFFLDPLNPQSELSVPLLRFVENVVTTHPEYAARLRRHYAMWKAVVDDPNHPCQAILRSRKPGYGVAPDRTPPRRPKVGPNEPCPCGSGKKHKRCCRR